MDVHSLFGTPILVTEFVRHEHYASKFYNFEKIDRKPNEWSMPLNTSFPNIQENDPYIDWDTAKQIKNDLLLNVQTFFGTLDLPTTVHFSEFWYNAYYEGQGQECHNHLSPTNFNPFWSGIYFARNCFPETFFFQRTDWSLRTQQSIDWTQTKLAHFYHDVIVPPIYDGQIVLFPPHLQHSVKSDDRNKDAMRLTFSFNVKLSH